MVGRRIVDDQSWIIPAVPGRDKLDRRGDFHNIVRIVQDGTIGARGRRGGTIGNGIW